MLSLQVSHLRSREFNIICNIKVNLVLILSKFQFILLNRTIFIGNLLIIMAQIIVAIQMVYEQKYLHEYNVPALFAVGLEGILFF